MKRLTSTLIALILAFVFSPVYAENPSYVGVKKCKGCHSGPKNGSVYEKWKKDIHAKAFETLKKKGEEKNPRCLSCHVTGFNDGGYKIGASDASDFEGVQCEACHGKGSMYKKSSNMTRVDLCIENGMIIPRESLCIKCHNKRSPTFKGFDYSKYAKKVDHIFRESY